MPALAVDDRHIFFEEAGSGETMVLLHGLGSCGQDWVLQMPVFSSRFHVIAPDLPGHGQTNKPHGQISITQMASDIAGLLDLLEVRRAHVVGLSLGGCVAQQIALDQPARVRSLTLANTFARFDLGGPRVAIPLMLRLSVLRFVGLPAQAQIVAARLFPKPGQESLRALAAERIAANDPATYRRVLSAIRSFDATGCLSRITCPTLVVAGDRDTTVPLRAKRLLAAHIPDARFELVADSGHATPIDQPEAFNRLVLEFVGSVKCEA